MKKEVAYRVDEALSMNGIDTEIYENYSGRGMYGNTTTAVVIPQGVSNFQILDAIRDNEYIFDEGLPDMDSFNRDQLGLDRVIY